MKKLLKFFFIRRVFIMKTSTKAILLSAFIIPGLGQLYLRRYRQGLVLMIVAVAGLAYIIWRATVAALDQVDRVMQSGSIDVKELTNIATSKSAGSSALDTIILLVIICCWVIGIVDAYISGRRKNIKESTAAKL